MKRLLILAALTAVAAHGGEMASAIGKKFLPNGADISSWETVYREVDALDAAADRGWTELKTRAEYDTKRRAMHAQMIEAIGGLPERTPLNAKTTGMVKREGYRIEKVLFESMPGLYVTANLFLPDSDKPVPAVVMSCGHAKNGKDCDIYLRACVNVVKRGMAAFMFDPYEQGERIAMRKKNCTNAHNLIGVRAMLLGWSMPMLRIWDGMRAIDYVQTRPEIIADKIGYMGQSGGGTMTALMTAADWRLNATAPSCYLTSLGYLCRIMGPQDAEQNIFGQLKFGLNHTGYVLMPDTKVCVTGRFSDMFPWGGCAQLLRTLKDTTAMLGNAGNYAANFAPGPHGWTESTENASADWMAAWLKGEKKLLPLDMPKYMAMDIGFAVTNAELGLTKEEIGVTPERDTMKVAGAKDIRTILQERLAAFEKARKPLSADEKRDLARRLAVIRDAGEDEVIVKEVTTEEVAGGKLTRIAFMYRDGLSLPAVMLVPNEKAKDEAPVLMAAARGRTLCENEAVEAMKAGKTVMIADVTGCGDIGNGLHEFYDARDTPEEGTAVMLYLMGESMVGRRATDLLMLGRYLGKRFGRQPKLLAKGTMAVAAAHAFAADRNVFAEVSVADASPTWKAYVESMDSSMNGRYAESVHGALRWYDWPDLLEK